MPARTRSRSRSPRLAAALALCGAATLATAAPALADSIVFVKDANIWLANPDGSGQYQVTSDGTAANPWKSPSQADDGTIVAVRAQPNLGPIVRMKQNGELINEIPVAMMQYGPFEPAISPDGTKVAYENVFRNSFETSNDVRITDVSGLTSPTVYGHPGSGNGSPSWLGNDRIFTGDYTSAGTMVLGQAFSEWWNDWDHADRFGSSEDLDDGEVAADGTIAFVRGDRDDNTIQLYSSGGLGTRPVPTCTLSNPTHGPLGARFSDPTLAPGGGAIAWQEGDGIWTATLPAGNCGAAVPRLTFPGASEPDWGPAAVNPGPRPQPHVDPPRTDPPRTDVPRTDPPRRVVLRRTTPRATGCATLTGAKRDACALRAALARCQAGPKRKRAACAKSAKRSAAVKACARKPAKARKRCVAVAKRRYR